MKLMFMIFTVVLFSTHCFANSELLSKVCNDDSVCSLFIEKNKYLLFPKGVLERKYIKPDKISLDYNNDGKKEMLFKKEHFTKYETNIVYYVLPLDFSPVSGSESELLKNALYVFPQSWMTCSYNKDCNLDNKMADGELVFGLILGSSEPVYYRSRYTNVFPFIIDGVTYFKITTESTNKNIVSIVKLSGEKLELVCAFKTGKKL